MITIEMLQGMLNSMVDNSVNIIKESKAWKDNNATKLLNMTTDESKNILGTLMYYCHQYHRNIMPSDMIDFIFDKFMFEAGQVIELWIYDNSREKMLSFIDSKINIELDNVLKEAV